MILDFMLTAWIVFTEYCLENLFWYFMLVWMLFDKSKFMAAGSALMLFMPLVDHV